jgi:hypothetical protein
MRDDGGRRWRMQAGIECMDLDGVCILYARKAGEYYGISGVAQDIIQMIALKDEGVSYASLIHSLSNGVPLKNSEIACVDEGVQKLVELGAIHEI